MKLIRLGQKVIISMEGKVGKVGKIDLYVRIILKNGPQNFLKESHNV